MKERTGYISNDGKFSSFISCEVASYEEELIEARLISGWRESPFGLLQFLDAYRSEVTSYIERNDPF